MPSGGARNRSGPKPTDTSLNAAKRGLVFEALPAGGYDGSAPDFPLPASSEVGGREAAIWDEIWRTPQACVWAVESWRWSIIGEYCRLKATVESDPGASAALVGQLHRYRDQIGLTPAGLKENGWKVAATESAEKATGTSGRRSSSRSRLKVVGNDG